MSGYCVVLASAVGGEREAPFERKGRHLRVRGCRAGVRVPSWGPSCRLETTQPEALELKKAMPSLLRGTEHTFESVARRLSELNAGIDAVRTQARAADCAAASSGGGGSAGRAGSGARSASLPMVSGGEPSATVPSLLLADPSRGSCGSPNGVPQCLCC